MKKLLAVMLGLFLAVSAVPALANHDGKDHDKKCAMSEGKCDKCEKHSQCDKCDKGDKDCESMCPIIGKTLKKAHFFLENAEAIGLSDDQVKQIKAIKMDTKKSAIRMKAEYEIFEMDMMAKLGEDKIDVEGLNAMLDAGAAGMTTGGKASVANYAKLKGILNDSQKAKAKEIWKAKK